MTGKKIAIFGLGRSGLGVAKAGTALGNDVRIYDESSSEKIVKRDVVEEADRLGIPVFFEWKGGFQDRPDFLVVNPAVRREHPLLQKAVDDGLEVIGEIEFAYLIAKAPIVAITGTNGKSTTTVMTYLCLGACGIDAVLCGNIFGSGYPEKPLTEAALESDPSQILVAEISSYQLEWISRFRPVAATITNVWPDHLDRYASFEEYATTKQKIFMNMTGSDVAVVRANDPVVVPPGGRKGAYVPRGRRRATASMAEPTGPIVWTFGATGEQSAVDERELRIFDRKVLLESLPFQEPHNYQNASVALLLSVATLSKGDFVKPTVPDCLIEGLRSFRGLEHRMEFLGEKDGVRVINNSMCTNPDAVIKSVSAVRDRVHILMGGVNKGLNFGPLRHYLANHRHAVYLYGTDASELNEMLGGGYPQFGSMQDAFSAATDFAKSKEVLMLSPGCASTDSFLDFRDRGNVFKAIAKDWLRT